MAEPDDLILIHGEEAELSPEAEQRLLEEAAMRTAERRQRQFDEGGWIDDDDR